MTGNPVSNYKMAGKFVGIWKNDEKLIKIINKKLFENN